MKHSLALSAFLAILAAGAAAQQPAFPAILNYLRVNEQFSTGGQPTTADLAKMKSSGVKAIINLRLAREFDADAEAAAAKSLGLRYIWIPVDTANPKDDQADAFLKATSATENRPAFVHCGSANRVGTFWMIRRVLVDGWTPEKAEEEARRIGMHSPNLIEFARRYIQRHKKK